MVTAFQVVLFIHRKKWNEYGKTIYQGYDALNLFGLQIAYPRYYLYRKGGGGIMINAKSGVMTELSYVRSSKPFSKRDG